MSKMLQKVAAALPAPVATGLRTTLDAARSLPYRGTGRFCPVCGKSSSRFRPFGDPPRPDAQCTRCGSLERTRLLWCFIEQNPGMFFGDRSRRMLHVAPLRCMERRIRPILGENYITADLQNPRAMVRMDIMDIQYPDGHFDIILCSHVLEHVDDDRKAMTELRRVLKRDGCAVLLVPIMAERTFEDPSITDPAERKRLFGQHDHVRAYGPDYVDRLRAAGFVVHQMASGDLLDASQRARYGVTEGAGDIFYCVRSDRA